MRAVRKAISLAVIAVILLVIYIFFIGDFFLKTDSIIYESYDLPKSFVGFKIAHVSDLYDSDNFVSAVTKSKPDIVIISGNLSSESGSYSKSVKAINRLAQSIPTYYVFGESDSEEARNAMRGSLNATELTGNAIDLQTPEIDIQQFIEEVYGSNLYEKAEKGDETSKEYVEYLNSRIADEKASGPLVTIMGIGTYEAENSDKAVDDLYELFVGNEQKYKICAASQSSLIDSLSVTGANLIFSGNTQSAEMLKYKDGVYHSNNSTAVVNPGVKNKGGYRRPIGGHRKVQIITLSDGSVKKMNPLEKFLNNIMGDTATDFDNDGGFQKYHYTYDSYGNEK